MNCQFLAITLMTKKTKVDGEKDLSPDHVIPTSKRLWFDLDHSPNIKNKSWGQLGDQVLENTEGAFSPVQNTSTNPGEKTFVPEERNSCTVSQTDMKLDPAALLLYVQSRISSCQVLGLMANQQLQSCFKCTRDQTRLN